MTLRKVPTLPIRDDSNGLSRILVLVGLVGFATAQEARAYIDPGSGALIWQFIVAAMVGGLFYLRKLNPVRWLRSLKKKSSEPVSH